ncbi:MAG: hypothetical protein WBN31_02270 [Gammaproteobacteria bacterium]
MKMLVSGLTIGLVILLNGCAAPTSTKTKDLEVAPQFTEEEKEAMSQEEKVAVYNESMSSEKEKLVCRREKPTGSRMYRTKCYTRAEIEEQRNDAQEALHGAGAGLPVGN